MFEKNKGFYQENVHPYPLSKRIRIYSRLFTRSGADIFLNWLSRQTKAFPVLQRAHVSRGYQVYIQTPQGRDFNEDLMMFLGMGERQKECLENTKRMEYL